MSKTTAAAAKKPAAAARAPKGAGKAKDAAKQTAAAEPTPPPPPIEPEPDIDAAPSGTGPVIPPVSETAASDAAAEAALRGESDPEPTTQSDPEPEPDFESEDVVSGREVPVFNPLPIPQTVQFTGLFHTVRARGTDLMPKDAASHAVGPENEGGVMSHTGMRRLYGPEPRFQDLAVGAGLSLEEWCLRRNESIEVEAESMGAAYAATHGLQDDTEGDE